MIPAAVLAAFPASVRDCAWIPLPPGGGLNGGRVWRGEWKGNPLFALKRWPVSHTPERITLVHDRMRISRAYTFVPRLHPTHANTTFVAIAGHIWDVTDWMPGTPDLLDTPTPANLRAAGEAIALLHDHWARPAAPLSPSAAVARRLQLLTEWVRARFHFNGPPEVVSELASSVHVVRGRVERAQADLRRAESIRGELIPIHGDYWPENVLFVGDQVSAVLDFGNVGFDHPEVDLGRLFADVPGANRIAVEAATAGYNDLVPYRLSEPLVELLASSGRLASLANWHLRLNAGSPDAGLLSAALPRLRRLVSLIHDERG